MSYRHRAVLIVVAGALLAAACGTRADKKAFYESLRTGTTVLPSGGGTGAGSPSGDGTGQEGSPSGQAGTSGGGSSANAGAPGGQVSGADSSVAPEIPDVSSEVVGDTIAIGMHVPITGAAPIPTDFMSTVRMLEDYVNNEARIFGRKVSIHVEDDGYDAQVALAACRRIAEDDPLFVIGHSMPAAEDACAAYFGERGIPYLMRGTYPDILNGRPLAWFGTVPDDVQGRLLADYVLNQLGGVGHKSAVVYQNDQTAAKGAFVDRIQGGGGSIVASEQSVPRQEDYAATVEKLSAAGAEFVLLSMPPVDAIKISTQSSQAGYHPVFLGGGTWWNYNMTLESAGMALDRAIVLSPWASIDSAGADEFKAVSRKYRPNAEPDDIGLIIWGWVQLVHSVLESAGQDLSRASFVRALQSFQFSAPYWQPITYTPTDHRGADTAAVFQGDGQARRWRQISGFTSSL